VVGSGGQLARSLVGRAAPSGLAIIAIGRPELDLLEPTSIGTALDAVQPDIVINAAAYTAVDKAESEPEMAIAVNAIGAEALARACSSRAIPFIHVSTDYVFDGSKSSPYSETDPVAPLGAYGRSKLDGEQRVAAACPKHIILRTAWVFSPYGQNFVKTMLRLASSRPEISVVDDQIGNPTYAPHLAAAIVQVAQAAAHREDVPWGIYHAVGSGEVTWCGLAREVFAVSKSLGGPKADVRAITTADYPTPARRPANSRLECTRLRDAFGVEMPAWRAGVKDCVRELLTVREPEPLDRSGP
jgi:dTDP-4-dehydrorhamnose reductase